MTTDLNPPLLPMSRATPFHPPSEYDALRAGGIKRFTWPNGVQAWLVARHEDVREALRDQRLSVDKTASPPPSLALGRSPGVMLPRSLVGMDPPEHTRWRGPVMRELTVRRVARLRPRIESIVAEHLDRMERQGPPADLVRSFALPIPSLVISELLGVPADDQPQFRRYTQIISTVGAPAEEVHAASAALMRYLGELIGSKRGLPGDDILSHLAMEFPEDDGPSSDGLLGNGMLLLIAGHETTANMLALSVVTLLEWPDQLAMARSGSDAMDRAVEELLRFHAVIQYGIVRRAAADLVLGGQEIRAGEWVVCSLASANRDTALCADPERFRVDRAPEAHVSFGYGIHQCAGQHLARLELGVALSALFNRFPGLRLAEPVDRLQFRNDMFVYGLHRLPLEW
jgi:cytochrome P450